MDYLTIVNRVLRRLRENEVTTINENPYSKLISDLVNVVLREVEDMWDWDSLRGTLTATTLPNAFNYVLAGASNRFRILNVVNDTTNVVMTYKSSAWFDLAYLIPTTVQSGPPTFYTFNGVDAMGDGQMDIYPPPDGVYAIRVNAVYPNHELVADADTLTLHPTLIIEGTLARAISERGEDGSYVEQEQRFSKMASDLIAIESERRYNETDWTPC